MPEAGYIITPVGIHLPYFYGDIAGVAICKLPSESVGAVNGFCTEYAPAVPKIITEMRPEPEESYRIIVTLL